MAQTSQETRMPQHVMAVVAYDSQLKWAMGIISEFTSRGWTSSVVVPSDIRSALSEAQRETLGIESLDYKPWEEIVSQAREADCVILAVQGPLVERFTDELQLLRQGSPAEHSPVIVAGWVGIIIEKIIAGYLDRCAADVIAVNSGDNLRDFTAAADLLDLPTSNLLLSGLPLLPARPATVRSRPVKTVLFADQPTVPATSWDRAYVYERLISYARLHPEREVLLRPRHRPEESTFHFMRFHPETMVAKLPEPPENFSITYEPITDLLERIDLMVTVSSTAGLEAVGHGVATAFVGDLGIHEKHGNHVLLPSGLISTFDELDADRLPLARESWLRDVFVEGDELHPAERVAERVIELTHLPASERPSADLEKSSYIRGRIAVRQRRAVMPLATQSPSLRQHVAKTWPDRVLAVRKNVRRRARHGAEALLPRKFVKYVRSTRRSRRTK